MKNFKIMLILGIFAFLNIHDVTAMELLPAEKSAQEEKKASEVNKEDVQKMMLLKEHMKNMDAEHSDVHGLIGQTLQKVIINPVLNATMSYSNLHTGQKDSFKIDSKVKDGIIDLSGYSIVTGSHSVVKDYLVI